MDSIDVLLDGGRLDLLAVDGVASIEVDGIHRQLELVPEGKLLAPSFQEGIVQPPHKVTEL